MRNRINPIILAACLALPALPAAADTFVTPGAPNGNGFDITDYRLSDSFELPANGVLTDIGFYYQAQFQTDLSTITYAIYAGSSGGNLRALQSASTSSISTSFDSASGMFFADFSVKPVALAGGTPYLLELHAGSSLTDTSGFLVSWAAVDDYNNPVALVSYDGSTPSIPLNYSGYEQYTVNLTLTATPEPGSLFLLGIGVLLLAFPVRARRRAQELNR